MFKYSNKVTIIGNNIKMNGKGVQWVIVEGELWDISDLISDIKSELYKVTHCISEFTFYVHSNSLYVEYDVCNIPDIYVERANRFLYNSDITIIKY